MPIVKRKYHFSLLSAFTGSIIEPIGGKENERLFRKTSLIYRIHGHHTQHIVRQLCAHRHNIGLDQRNVFPEKRPDINLPGKDVRSGIYIPEVYAENIGNAPAPVDTLPL